MPDSNPPDDNDGIPGIDKPLNEDEGVGYGRPPKQHRFKKGQSGNPKGRPKRILMDKIQIASLLEAPVTATVKGKREKLQVIEVGLRKLAQRSIQERHLDSTIQLLKHAIKLGLIQKPRASQNIGVLHVPTDWDPDEWRSMFNRHGFPPWPGRRDGFTKDDRARIMAPAFDVQGPAETPALQKISREKWPQRDILRHLLLELHTVNDGDKRVHRTTLDLVVLVLRSHVTSGRRPAMRFLEALLGEFGTPAAGQSAPVVVIPEPLSAPEWVMRYHAGTEEEKRKIADEMRAEDEARQRAGQRQDPSR